MEEKLEEKAGESVLTVEEAVPISEESESTIEEPNLTSEEAEPTIEEPVLNVEEAELTNEEAEPTVKGALLETAEPELVLVDSKGLAAKSGRRKRSKKFYFLIFTLLFLCIFAPIVSVIGYQTFSADYHSDLSLAQAGARDLQSGITLLKSLQKKPFNATAVTQAQSEFTAASRAFTQLDNALKSLPSLSTSVPVYGSRLSAAFHILPIAIEAAQTGIVACSVLNIIIPAFHDPLNTRGGLTMASFNAIEKDFNQIKAALTLITGQVNSLQPADLQADPRITAMVALFHKDLPALQVSIDQLDTLLPVLPLLLGIEKPTNYLIEVLDSTELRPGGGFIGNYGILTLSGGRLAGTHISDTYLLDDAFAATGKAIAFPSSYSWFDLAPGWALRDSNLDADFPTAAQYSELNYHREGGTVQFQGVIAITPAVIQKVLAITGPISVPQYHEVVTAQNLIDRIHYYQVGQGKQGGDVPSPDGQSSVRKHFTALLADQLLARVRQVAPTAPAKFFQVMLDSLRSKDIQIYFNSPVAEGILQHFALASTIQAPAGDSLFVVDANISPNKATELIKQTLNDQVSLDAAGNALHKTTLRYAWTVNGPVYGLPTYRDYVRVYVPPDSTLSQQRGWQPRGTGTAFGRKVWAGFFTLNYGQTLTITLEWKVPHAAISTAKGWHYQELIQRQAGAVWTVNASINLPSCGVIKGLQGKLVSADKNHSATLSQYLNEDLNEGIVYTCLTSPATGS